VHQFHVRDERTTTQFLMLKFKDCEIKKNPVKEELCEIKAGLACIKWRKGRRLNKISDNYIIYIYTNITASSFMTSNLRK
jgi:hypothetical protein